jgi:hypothetical protein
MLRRWFKRISGRASAGSASDLGLVALRRLAKQWQIDDDRIRWADDGFEWWPGRFRVSVRSNKHPDESEGKVWRLSFSTAFLRDIDGGDEKIGPAIFAMPDTPPTYAWVYPPIELIRMLAGRLGMPFDGPGASDEIRQLVGRTIEFFSTIYLREDTAESLGKLFGGLAILQPADAELLAEDAAHKIGGRLDESRPSEAAQRGRDELLEIGKILYVPAGQHTSLWAGSDEFEFISQTYGKNHMCFGVSDETGVTLQTPLAQNPLWSGCSTTPPIPYLEPACWRRSNCPSSTMRR